jgi:hypothetical protein
MRCEGVPCLFCGHECAEQVRTGCLPSGVDDWPEIGVDRPPGVDRDLDFRRGDGGLEQARTLVRPPLELGAVFGGHPEQFGHHNHRQRGGQGLNDIKGRRVRDLVQQGLGNRPDAGRERRNGWGGEGFIHQGAQPRVVGGI